MHLIFSHVSVRAETYGASGRLTMIPSSCICLAASSICAGVAANAWLTRTRSLSLFASSDASSARRERSGTLRRSSPPWNGRSKTKYSIASLFALSIAFCSALKSGTPRAEMTTISPSIHAESIASASIAAASGLSFAVQSWPPRVISFALPLSMRVINR